MGQPHMKMRIAEPHRRRTTGTSRPTGLRNPTATHQRCSCVNMPGVPGMAAANVMMFDLKRAFHR
jgi:hypothetical protein